MFSNLKTVTSYKNAFIVIEMCMLGKHSVGPLKI